MEPRSGGEAVRQSFGNPPEGHCVAR
jgi:hypothetical protein